MTFAFTYLLYNTAGIYKKKLYPVALNFKQSWFQIQEMLILNYVIWKKQIWSNNSKPFLGSNIQPGKEDIELKIGTQNWLKSF